MTTPKIFGLAGWSGSGKTTLALRVIQAVIGRGLTVSTIKHTHHGVDLDKPGKDPYRQRRAGAAEVMLASGARWALMRELEGETEWSVNELAARMSPVDLILIEGFKSKSHPKLEVHRPSLGAPLLADRDDAVVAVASDEDLPGLAVPVLGLNDVGAVTDFILAHVGLADKSKGSENRGAA